MKVNLKTTLASLYTLWIAAFWFWLFWPRESSRNYVSPFSPWVEAVFLWPFACWMVIMTVLSLLAFWLWAVSDNFTLIKAERNPR